MRVLPDLTQKSVRAQSTTRVVLLRDDLDFEPGKPAGAKAGGCTGRWNRLSFPERVPTTPPVVETRASGGRRQHLAPRNAKRLYRPQDQRGVQTVFVMMDRITGQVLARVRGNASHAEVEAEKLARSQGCELTDLKVIFEGEFL